MELENEGRLYVTTLALGSRPKQGVARLQAKREARESCRTPKSARKCEGIDLHTLRELPYWGLESQWTSKCSKSNYRGQNSMA
jgi:hypothetical protein